MVPELATLTANCPVQLTDSIVYMDSGYSRLQTTEQMMQSERDFLWQQQQSHCDDDNGGSHHDNTTTIIAASPWCAAVGPVNADGHRGLSVLTEYWNIPQLAYATRDVDLADAGQYPNLVRLVASAGDVAHAMATALQSNVTTTCFVRFASEGRFQ